MMSRPPVTFIELAGQPVAHAVTGTGPDVLLLHGWGAHIGLVWPLATALAGQGFRAHALDLPGFGDSAPPPADWGVADYARLVLAYLDAQRLARVHLFGHSFGGRVSLILGADHAERLHNIALCSSAGVRAPLPWHRALPLAVWRRVQPLLPTAGPVAGAVERARAGYRDSAGSADYNAADDTLRAVLRRVVDEDLLPYAARVARPTLLLWGDQDTDTPLWQGQTLERTIPDAGLVVLPGAGHYGYLDGLPHVTRVLTTFYRGTPIGEGQ